MSIEVRNLLKQYGTQNAVNRISFQVNKGEIVGFLGPNGAGKSTTMKILTGYIQANEGEALVCGIQVSSDPLSARKKIGYLPELNALYYEMYVREYLAFVAEVHKLQNSKEAVARAINMVGLDLEAGKKIGQLSKGYKQRVGLAAALIHDPEVLILDEPTSGLDPNQIVEIREVIRKQGKDKTVLFSSHILQEVEAICDRVIIINKGEIVANDRLEALQSNSSAVTILSVEFQENVDKQLLESISSVSRVEAINPKLFKIQTKEPELVRKQILQLALQHNLNIVSLQSDSRSLEDIFRTLTQQSIN